MGVWCVGKHHRARHAGRSSNRRRHQGGCNGRLPLWPSARHNARTPNIASVFKSEIARVARKEIRAETDSLKKASAQYRSTVAALKRDVAALGKQLKQQSKWRSTASAASAFRRFWREYPFPLPTPRGAQGQTWPVSEGLWRADRGESAQYLQVGGRKCAAA